MAYALRTASSLSFASWGNPQSIGSFGGTNVGDCIILVICISSSPTLTVSGCGATWVRNTESTGPQLAVFIGYGCTANSSAATLSVGGASGLAGDYVLGIFSGVLASGNPIRGAAAVGTATSAQNITTGSLTYVAGDLLIGAGGWGTSVGTWTAPSVWSNGGTDNAIALTNSGQRNALATYQISASGSSTTYKVANGGTANGIRAVALALEPVITNQGDMIQAMGL